MNECKVNKIGWLPKGTVIRTGEMKFVNEDDWDSGAYIPKGKKSTTETLKRKLMVAVYRDPVKKECIFRVCGERRKIISAKVSAFVLHKEKNPKIKAKCKYCGKTFSYSALIGNVNMGACNKSKCILNAMQDCM